MKDLRYTRKTAPRILLNLRHCAALVALLLYLPSDGFGAQGFPLSDHLYHTPVLQATAGADLEFRFETDETIQSVQSATLLWRPSGSEFRQLEMNPVTGGYSCIVPGAEVVPPSLEYALLIHLAENSILSFPLRDPLLVPQIVNVVAGRKAIGPQFQVLYPQEGETVFDPEARVAVSIFDPDSTFYPASLKVALDGKNVPVQKLSSSYLFLSLSGLKPGRHHLTLFSQNFTGESNPNFSWSFQVAGRDGGEQRRDFRWGFTGEAGSENFASQRHDYLRGDLRGRAKWRSWEAAARCYLTKDESPNLQPQDRFLLKISQRHLNLTLGDATPVFSDLVLSGKRVRGAEMGLHAGPFHLQGVFGEITRGIEGSSYRRMLGSIRPYFTTPSGCKFGFTFLKAKDDLSSISQAIVSPQDNIVAGTDLSVPLFDHKLQWSISAALSLTALDIRGGSLSDSLLKEADIEIPFDPQAWENLLVINESLSPPNPLTMSSLAWTTTLNLNHFGQAFSLNYRSIGPAYRSLGNPYLLNDQAGWNLSDQFSALDHRMFVTLGFNRVRDNLKKTKSATTTSTGGWVALSLYPASNWPQLSATLNFTRGTNDQSSIDTLALGGDTLFTDQRRDEISSSASISATQNLYLMGRRHVLTLNLNSALFRDQLEDRPPGYTTTEATSRNFGINGRTMLSRPLTLAWDYSYFSSEAVVKISYQQLGGALHAKFDRAKLNLSSGIHRRIGAGNLARWQSDLGGEWGFHPRNRLRLVLTHYLIDDDRDEGIYRLYYFKLF